MLKMLAATTNKNKVREFQEILEDLKDKVEIITLDSIPFTETRNDVRKVNTAYDAYERLY